jgi:KaiC/GvpD/RAD55 family RecA-like ATPase
MQENINFKDKLLSLPDEWIVLINSPNEISDEVSYEAINYLIEEKEYVGIILTASKPYATLKKNFNGKGIDTDRIIFIDCISKSQSTELEKVGNVIYIDAVYNLTNISLAFKKIIKRIEGKKFFYVDSLTAMLIHNNQEIFVRFIHGLITSMRLAGISGFLISLDADSDDAIKERISNLCDKTIKIE